MEKCIPHHPYEEIQFLLSINCPDVKASIEKQLENRDPILFVNKSLEKYKNCKVT